MKQIVVWVVAVVVLAFAGAAAASNGQNNGNGNANKSDNGAQTASFNASYNNALGGHLDCSGERIAKSGWIKDTEQCTLSDPASFFPSGRSVGTQDANGYAYITLNGFNWYWFSDFDGRLATAMTFVVSGGGPDGTAHVSIVAYY
jgi:type II secretory pathway pseudopilin PulG